MYKITTLLTKALLVALVLGLGLTALPVSSAHAAASPAEGTPSQGEVSNERLEQIWAREINVSQRIGQRLDRADTIIGKVQELINKAAERGYDTSAVQAALDAFSAALQDARPIYQSAHGIIQSHRGFDEDGKVVDRAQAIESVRELGQKLREVRAAMRGTGRALCEAIRAFREANRPEPSPAQ